VDDLRMTMIRCAWFSLNEVGVPLEELKKVAEGLAGV
jgi:hypothetical protein